ncbi:Nse4-domain-containing protein [Wilcoxina mikolae CBS 423.85]|nr:Nse4-domain-containing protein [Wilcoxina mikolae CBS 423.85]
MPRSSVEIPTDVEASDEDITPPTSRRAHTTRHASSDKENATPAAKNSRTARTASSSTANNSRGLRDMEPSQALHQNVLDVEGDLSVYDPDQPAHERREVRKGYRTLQRRLDESKTEFLRPDNDGLLETFMKADELYKNVKQTSDATLDSRLLVAASDLALKKVSNMVVGSSGVGIDVDEFVGKCISFMRNADPNDEEEEDGDAMDWAYLGRAAAFKGNKRPATSDFLLGPLSVQKKIRLHKARRQGLGRKKGEKAAVPTNVEAEDIKQSENNTLKLVHEVQLILKNYLEENDLPGDELCLFNAVINPESFGQTVENIFFVSFLAKEGHIAVHEDEETGLPMIALSEPANASQKDAGIVQRNQIIFSITMWQWKQFIEVFDIRESIIPTRAKEATIISATGWYT